MKFKIISVKDNSVRVKSGMFTIDVKIIDGIRIVLPANIYIANKEDFNNLAGAVLAEYNKSNEDNISHDNKKREGLQ